jgi:hypothetical protein
VNVKTGNSAALQYKFSENLKLGNSVQVFEEYEEVRKTRGSGIEAKEKQKHLVERDRRIDGRIRKSFLETDFL